MIFLTHCWVQFANILLKIFESTFIGDIGLVAPTHYFQAEVEVQDAIQFPLMPEGKSAFLLPGRTEVQIPQVVSTDTTGRLELVAGPAPYLAFSYHPGRGAEVPH